MDASDKLRRDMSKTIYNNYVTMTLSKQAACNYSTCVSTLELAGCVKNFKDFEQRYEVALGRQNTATCATAASTFYF
jgi:hypothetical protein|uniref:Uncharacterized protein n=1 Tax=viral metagenome TaxID=1070528 RepID=A0A6C0JXG8_9ZZZZ